MNKESSINHCPLLRDFSFGYLMKRDIVESSRKFKKRRKLRGKDSEFCMGCFEFEMPLVYPGVDVQKVIGNNEKSEMTVNIWEFLIQGYFFPKDLKHITGSTQRL